MSGRNRPCMHPTISFHVPDGYCGSDIYYLPTIYKYKESESIAQNVCRRSSGCIGYAYNRYGYNMYVYFSSFNEASKAASTYISWSRNYGTICTTGCSINGFRSPHVGYKCYRKSATVQTTTEYRDGNNHQSNSDYGRM